MNALSRNLGLMLLLVMTAFVSNAQTYDVKINTTNALSEKKAESFKALLLVREKAGLRKYPTNKSLPLGEIRTYLEEVDIEPNSEERWVLAQFLSLNGWDLFKNDGFETKFTGKRNENAMLSVWIRNNKDLFKAGNISKKDLAVAK